MKTKKIAGVSVNLETPPTKEDLVNSALKTKEYYRMPKEDALKDINRKIKESGLYNNLPKADTNEKRDRKVSKRADNTEFRDSDTNS